MTLIAFASEVLTSPGSSELPVVKSQGGILGRTGMAQGGPGPPEPQTHLKASNHGRAAPECDASLQQWLLTASKMPLCCPGAPLVFGTHVWGVYKNGFDCSFPLWFVIRWFVFICSII